MLYKANDDHFIHNVAEVLLLVRAVLSVCTWTWLEILWFMCILWTILSTKHSCFILFKIFANLCTLQNCHLLQHNVLLFIIQSRIGNVNQFIIDWWLNSRNLKVCLKTISRLNRVLGVKIHRKKSQIMVWMIFKKLKNFLDKF